MYSDAPTGGMAAKAEGDEEHKEGEEKQYALPKEILEGKKFDVGDEVVLRITAMHDEQIFVTYAPAKEQEKGKTDEGMAEEAPAGGAGGGDSEMQSMME